MKEVTDKIKHEIKKIISPYLPEGQIAIRCIDNALVEILAEFYYVCVTDEYYDEAILSAIHRLSLVLRDESIKKQVHDLSCPNKETCDILAIATYGDMNMYEERH